MPENDNLNSYSLAPDPVGTCFSAVRVSDKGEKKDRSLHPEKENPFKEESHETTGDKEAMKDHKFSFDEQGKGEKGRQKEIGPEEGQKNPSFFVGRNFFKRDRRSDF